MSQFDWLSYLLKIVSITGKLEAHCSYAAPWCVNRAPSESHAIPYLVLLEGTAIVELPDMGRARKLAEGDILMLPHGATHVLHDGSGDPPSYIYNCAGPSGWTISENNGNGKRVDMLSGRFFVETPHERLIRNYLPPVIVARAAERSGRGDDQSASNRLGSLVELMRLESSGDRSGGYAIFSTLSPVLFTLALSTAGESGPASPGWLALTACPRLAPAICAMFANPAYPWDLPDLANLCGMSRATFMRHFQERLGRSASKFLTDIRLGLAANELKTASTATEVVARKVGYRSVAAFRRVFTDNMGVTPGRWRRLMREERNDERRY